MLLAQKLKFAFSFNILNSIRNLKDAVTAPIKHLKIHTESSGVENSVQTNLTA